MQQYGTPIVKLEERADGWIWLQWLHTWQDGNPALTPVCDDGPQVGERVGVLGGERAEAGQLG